MHFLIKFYRNVSGGTGVEYIHRGGVRWAGPAVTVTVCREKQCKVQCVVSKKV